MYIEPENYLDSKTSIIKGNAVLIGQKLYLEAFIAQYNDSVIKSTHVSKYSGGMSPYFLPMNSKADLRLEGFINNL